MQSAECLRRVRPLVRERVPAELREFQWESYSFQSKLWYGNKALHYEVWPREKLGTIEIGLHFEADPLTNARLLAAFAANAKTVRRALVDARVEEWDRGWARVWQPLPYRKPERAQGLRRRRARRERCAANDHRLIVAATTGTRLGTSSGRGSRCINASAMSAFAPYGRPAASRRERRD
ncbi:MAG: hypothetical protein E6I19_01580 [Chloroflexi bacterium]|nr:MAG: hypothetical protein E6I19_01580 [Chloroflexota bacterium]